MSDTIITIENLSKCYLVGHQTAQREKYTALRDIIVREARIFVRKARDAVRGRQIIQGDEVEVFWALKNVSVDIRRGEVIGIIGRNGAGKSTLLKILSRITEPTEGRVVLRGRVASLLEVGTGFHSELTGRQNIFLNGAILGMKQREIRQKFNEIVAFAEVERFLDTPVKHYSSGMYVRLAFAVAAHLEPEILIVDEVLAVGDAKFQERCLGKMKEVATGGRTVIFVSHNMSAMIQLTKRAILLSQGKVQFVGTPSEAAEKYINDDGMKETTDFDVSEVKRHFEVTGDVKILSLRFDRPSPHFEFAEPLRYIIRVRAKRAVQKVRVAMLIYARGGSPVGNSFSPDIAGLTEGEERDLLITLSSKHLAPGGYFCAVSVGSGNHRTGYIDYDIVTDTLFFEVWAERTEFGAMAAWNQGWGPISFEELSIESYRPNE
jgi:lipopolysaccharide transport system ATP-binding protein